MTIIGKLLVFMVLLLSLVWNGLVVNAYVTRSNWAAEAKKYQGKAVEAADSANAMRKLVDAEREAAEDAKRVIREDRDQLYTRYAALEKQYADLNKAYQDKLDAEKAIGGTQNQLQANHKSLLEQVDNLTKLLQDKEKAITDMTLTTERSVAAKVKADLEAAAQQQRAERLYEQYQKLQEDFTEAKSGSRGALSGLDPKAKAPAGFRGTIRSRDGDFVSFTPGVDAGLQKGTTLTVFRLTPTPKYIGKIKVIQVDPKEGVGQFVAPAGLRLNADDYPKTGDELKAE